MKKLISLVLILALTLSLSAAALAAAPKDLSYDRDATLTAAFVKYGNITVKSGATLTIDKSSGFEIAGNITVEAGAKLICNGTGKGDFNFTMTNKNSVVSGIDLYFRFRTENGIEVRRIAGGYAAVAAMDCWDWNGASRPAFSWESSVQGWCLTGDTNVNLSDEPVYHSERDMDGAKQIADRMYSLGLFKGDDKGYSLNRAGSRIEALVMFIRLLGLEETALEKNWGHPFTDVPSWADPYVGYAYVMGLTAGVGGGKFGTGPVSAQMYFTFILRALGKTDSEGYKVYDHAMELIQNTGVVSTERDVYEVCTRDFWRSDMVVTAFRALSAVTESGETLGEKLVSEGVFSPEQLDSLTL